jgi:methyl-accepting chemotaxis protein
MVLLAVFIAGYTIFGLVSFSTLNTLRIDGQLYNQIIMSKDLIVDVLSPPEYIIESYLDVLLEVEETNPALQSGDRERAAELAYGELKNLYSTHRESVDQVVKGATEKYENTEALSNMTVQRDTEVLIAIAFVINAVAAVIVFFVVKSITKPIANIASVTDTLVKNGKNVKSLLEASEVGRTGLQEVAQNIQEIASSMDEMASGSDQINTAVNHVNEISGKNREAIDHLTREVSWFKVE